MDGAASGASLGTPTPAVPALRRAPGIPGRPGRVRARQRTHLGLVMTVMVTVAVARRWRALPGPGSTT